MRHSLFFILLLAVILRSRCLVAGKGMQDDSNFRNARNNDQHSALALSTFTFKPPHDSQQVEEWDEGDYIHDIDELEALLGGPLENRRFVSVRKISGGGRHREVTYKFRTNAREKRDSVIELKKDAKTHPYSLNATQLAQLQVPPKGFNSNTIYYHHTIQLTALERIQETNATLGSMCETKSLLDHDYCERAAYPNKNKMVCNKVLNITQPGTSILPNTCICKFYRVKEDSVRWKQMKQGQINLNNGATVDTCLVPAYGVCDHRQSTGIKDIHDFNVFEIDVCKGHFQCDNTKYLGNLVDKNMKILQVRNHCTEDDFLKMFEKKVRHKVLLCAKPHPRRFIAYDEYRYYCLPKKSRDPEQWQFQKPPPEEEDKEIDLFFED